MTRRYGRGPRNKRVIGRVPFNHRMTTTFVAGLRHDGIVAPLVLDRPMNGKLFLVYLKKVLAPTLSPGDIVVMDNLPAHKVSGIEEIITACGAELRYQPPYSPDLNPIELAFAKLKTLLRQESELRRVSGPGSGPCSIGSARRNAPTTSATQDTDALSQHDRQML